MTTAYDFSFRDLDGQPQALARYQGHPLLLVNVASRCGFTPQYTGLEQLWQDYRERGLVVIGFPCNQFGAQEPGDAAQIRQFCSLDYPVSFPLSEKIEVNGEGADPLWAWLRTRSVACSAVPASSGISASSWSIARGRWRRGMRPPPGRSSCAARLKRCCEVVPAAGRQPRGPGSAGQRPALPLQHHFSTNARSNT
jgi:glutathione peroxidase-family protein